MAADSPTTSGRSRSTIDKRASGRHVRAEEAHFEARHLEEIGAEAAAHVVELALDAGDERHLAVVRFTRQVPVEGATSRAA